MINLDILTEAAALSGYTITGSGQDVTNKARAQRRVNIVKADIISRFGGKWSSNYREGWVPLVPLYTTGTVTLTNASNTVTGSGTAWTSSMKGQKFYDGLYYYKIASVASATSLILTQPYQGTTTAGVSYLIWQDEYRLYPEVINIAGFVDYQLEKSLDESWSRNFKQSFPVSATTNLPSVYTVIGREPLTAAYSTGTVTGSLNSNALTGTSTLWLANVEPGFEITIAGTKYHVKKVNSDTSIELYQQLTAAAVAATYSAVGKNAIIVRFNTPTSQRVVHYWYWSKGYPLVNDNDEDWIAELYPKIILNGILYYDYLDKNDPIRTDRSSIAYEDSIKNMKVADDGAMTGDRTLAYSIPPEARD